jgi:hypothetical protein
MSSLLNSTLEPIQAWSNRKKDKVFVDEDLSPTVARYLCEKCL